MYLEIIQYVYHEISTHLFAKSTKFPKTCFVYADLIWIYYDFTAGDKNIL